MGIAFDQATTFRHNCLSENSEYDRPAQRHARPDSGLASVSSPQGIAVAQTFLALFRIPTALPLNVGTSFRNTDTTPEAVHAAVSHEKESGPRSSDQNMQRPERSP